MDEKILQPIVEDEIRHVTLIKLSKGYMVDIIGMMATAMAQDVDEAWEQHRSSELEKVERKGLAAVKKWVKSPMAKEPITQNTICIIETFFKK